MKHESFGKFCICSGLHWVPSADGHVTTEDSREVFHKKSLRGTNYLSFTPTRIICMFSFTFASESVYDNFLEWTPLFLQQWAIRSSSNLCCDEASICLLKITSLYFSYSQDFCPQIGDVYGHRYLLTWLFIHWLIQLYLWSPWFARHEVGSSRYASDMKPMDKDSVAQREKQPLTPVIQHRMWLGREVCESLENELFSWKAPVTSILQWNSTMTLFHFVLTLEENWLKFCNLFL